MHKMIELLLQLQYISFHEKKKEKEVIVDQMVNVVLFFNEFSRGCWSFKYTRNITHVGACENSMCVVAPLASGSMLINEAVQPVELVTPYTGVVVSVVSEAKTSSLGVEASCNPVVNVDNNAECVQVDNLKENSVCSNNFVDVPVNLVDTHTMVNHLGENSGFDLRNHIDWLNGSSEFESEFDFWIVVWLLRTFAVDLTLETILIWFVIGLLSRLPLVGDFMGGDGGEDNFYVCFFSHMFVRIGFCDWWCAALVYWAIMWLELVSLYSCWWQPLVQFFELVAFGRCCLLVDGPCEASGMLGALAV
ncbi:hypothetical protein KFK09_016460 [Dendrobium nobile]|uniref:Uncharacterized protein n=1 Tax=Dendrobium nobile TaxID=94219 RepID=A0A8T3B4T2_DENNO|nr:hypothetical protein KFK09_016460 [Dendrobium nobile]